MKKLALLMTVMLSVMVLFAQQRTVTGKVTDENGNPVANASVTIKESGTGVSTNTSGDYTLPLDSKAKTLVFSYVGKSPLEISIGNKTTVNANLKQENRSLDEVVVVAYGTQIKKKVTGAVSKVDGVEFENRPFTSVDQMLQGKVAGLQSVSPTGQPGGIQQVRIRGIGSITAGAAPLYVVDGVPINTGDFARLNNTSNALAGI